MSETQNVTINPERVLLVTKTALQARHNRQGIFHDVNPPEKPLIDLFKKYENRENYPGFAVNALFMFITTLYADDSTRQLTLTHWYFNRTPHTWLFKPEEAIKRSDKEIIQTAKDLIRPGYNFRAIEKWPHNLKLLANRYDGLVSNFLEEHDNHAPTVLHELVGPKRKMGYEGFHRFGPKIGRLFLWWLNHYQLSTLWDTNKIGIPVDFQIARLMIQTGGVKIDQPTHKHWVLDKGLVPFFDTFCQEHNFPPYLVSETLWMIGSRYCNRALHQSCPLQFHCDRLISRNPLDERVCSIPKMWAVINCRNIYLCLIFKE